MKLEIILLIFKTWVTFSISRSSHPEAFCKKCVLRIFAKFTGKHLCQSLFFNKVADQKTKAQVFSCEFCEISQNTFSYRTPPVAVFEFPNFFLCNNGLLLEILRFILGVIFCEASCIRYYIIRMTIFNWKVFFYNLFSFIYYPLYLHKIIALFDLIWPSLMRFPVSMFVMKYNIN